MKLNIGDLAPAWKGINQNSKNLSSDDFLGSWLLLYFYPKDDTPGCTIEACKFRDDFSVLSSRITIVGVSTDSVESHQKFIKKYSLPFSLISDEGKSMVNAFGCNGVLFPKRVTFLIDPKGVIQRIYHGFDCNLHSEDIQKDLSVLGI